MSDELDRLLDQYRDGIIASVRLASMRSDGPDRKEREQAAIEAGAAVIARAAIRAAWEGREDAARLDWMEANLCRAGEVRNSDGQCVKLCRVWSIMGELSTLRETIDAARTEGKGNG